MSFLAEVGRKKYLFQAYFSGGNDPLKDWVYITTDGVATVIAASYITDTEIIRKLTVGDYFRCYQVTDRDDLSTTFEVFTVRVSAKTPTSVSLAPVIRSHTGEVTLIQFGGVADYVDATNTGTDNRAALQAMLDWAHDQGGATVRVTRDSQGRGDYRLGNGETMTPSDDAEGVTIYDDTHLIIEAGCFLWRDWKSSTSNYLSATIINEHCPPHGDWIVDPGPYTQVDSNHDIRISGPGGFKITTAIETAAIAASQFSGPHVTLHWVDRPTIDNVAFGRVCRNSGVNIYGTDLLYIGNRHSNPTSSVFQTGLTVLGGEGGYIGGNIFDTGEDCIGIGSNYNIGLTDLEIGPNFYRSFFGHFIHIVQFRLGVTASYGEPTEYVQRINIDGGFGLVGQTSNAGIRINAFTGVTNPSLIRHIAINNVMIDQAGDSHDDSNAYGVLIQGGFDIRLTGKILSPKRNAIRITNGADRVFMNVNSNAASTASEPTIYLDDLGEVQISGLVQGRSDAPVIEATDVDLLRLVDLNILDVATNNYGVFLEDATKCDAQNVRFKRLTAATNTFGFRVDAAAVQLRHSRCDFDDVDKRVSFGATPTLYENDVWGSAKVVDVASGAVTINGGGRYLINCESDASDDLVTIAGGTTGMEIEIQSNEASPASVVLTAKHGTSTNQIDFTRLNAGGDYAINTATKGFRARKQGSAWIPIAIW